MQPPHILFISSWYPNRENASHGIFNRAFARAASLHSKVSVLHVMADDSVKHGFNTQLIDDGEIFTVYVSYPASRTPAGKLLQYRRRLKAAEIGYNQILQRRGKPRLIQLNVVLPAGIAAHALSKQHNIPLIINECWTGYEPLDGRYKGWLYKKLTKKIVAAAQCIIPVTSYLKDLMQKNDLNGNYEIVPNVIDTEIFKPEKFPDRKNLRFIHISALDDAQKNVSGILQAFILAKKHLPDSELVIAGDGSARKILQQKAATLVKDGSIIFKGLLNPSELAAEINKSDALIMFSNYETFCVAVPEALACGKPVITSNAGGIMSYMNEELGCIVPVGDVNALAGSLIDFPQTQKRFDPLKLRQFVVDNFSVPVVAQKLQTIYSSVLQDR